MDLADAVRQLKPDVAWEGVRLEGGGVDVEDGSPFVGEVYRRSGSSTPLELLEPV
jgi:hypothetical protein